MSEYNWTEDSENGNESDLAKRLRKEIEKRDNALKERDKEFETLKGELRRQNVGEILREIGVKSKVANLIPKDIEPTAEAVKAWVKEYEDVFGLAREGAPQEQAPPAPQEKAPEGQPGISEEQAAAWGRIQTQEASAGTSVPTGDDAQMQWLNNAAGKADGNADTFFAFLRGELNP